MSNMRLRRSFYKVLHLFVTPLVNPFYKLMEVLPRQDKELSVPLYLLNNRLWYQIPEYLFRDRPDLLFPWKLRTTSLTKVKKVISDFWISLKFIRSKRQRYIVFIVVDKYLVV